METLNLTKVSPLQLLYTQSGFEYHNINSHKYILDKQEEFKQCLSKILSTGYPVNIFIDAAAGAGKTYAISVLIKENYFPTNSPILFLTPRTTLTEQVGEDYQTITNRRIYVHTGDNKSKAALAQAIKDNYLIVANYEVLKDISETDIKNIFIVVDEVHSFITELSFRTKTMVNACNKLKAAKSCIYLSATHIPLLNIKELAGTKNHNHFVKCNTTGLNTKTINVLPYYGKKKLAYLQTLINLNKKDGTIIVFNNNSVENKILSDYYNSLGYNTASLASKKDPNNILEDLIKGILKVDILFVTKLIEAGLSITSGIACIIDFNSNNYCSLMQLANRPRMQKDGTNSEITVFTFEKEVKANSKINAFSYFSEILEACEKQSLRGGYDFVHLEKLLNEDQTVNYPKVISKVFTSEQSTLSKLEIAYIAQELDNSFIANYCLLELEDSKDLIKAVKGKKQEAKAALKTFDKLKLHEEESIRNLSLAYYLLSISNASKELLSSISEYVQDPKGGLNINQNSKDYKSCERLLFNEELSVRDFLQCDFKLFDIINLIDYKKITSLIGLIPDCSLSLLDNKNLFETVNPLSKRLISIANKIKYQLEEALLNGRLKTGGNIQTFLSAASEFVQTKKKESFYYANLEIAKNENAKIGYTTKSYLLSILIKLRKIFKKKNENIANRGGKYPNLKWINSAITKAKDETFKELKGKDTSLTKAQFTVFARLINSQTLENYFEIDIEQVEESRAKGGRYNIYKIKKTVGNIWKKSK